MNGLWSFSALWMVVAATCLVPRCFAQPSTASEAANLGRHSLSAPAVCGEFQPENGVKAALRLVCRGDTLGIRNIAVEKAIVIGFVGGFVRPDDMKHPEVEFAARLQEVYPPEVHAEVFANHDGKHALRRVLQLLNENGDGALTSREKEKASIIIYGHSWGASQVVTLARDLGRLGIPVSLTIQVDSVHKPGHDDAVIPPNVRNAVNFYQTKGFIHGRSRIRASDPKCTKIIGNFQMAYQNRPINCNNYPWVARHLNKPHHAIENDPLVWQQIASMIDSELSSGALMTEALLPSTQVVNQGQR
jgi:hypothetical protein